MKRYLFLLLGISIVLSACSSGKVIFNDPDFARSRWESKRIGVLPVLVFNTSYSDLTNEVINSKTEEVLAKRKLNHARLISPTIIEKEMVSKGAADDYLRVLESYRKLGSWESRKDFLLDSDDIKKIGGKLGLDRVVVFKIIRNFSSSEEDDKGREKTNFLSLTQMQIYDSGTGSLIYKYTKYGEYLYVEHGSRLLSILTFPAHVSKNFHGTYYLRAFESGVHRNLIEFNERFIGECVTGDCINGRGEFVIYQSGSVKDGKKDLKYDGPFLDNFAHGDGTYYYTVNGIQVKYDGLWEKGELKKKKQLYYLKDGEWVKVSEKALKNVVKSKL